MASPPSTPLDAPPPPGEDAERRRRSLSVFLRHAIISFAIGLGVIVVVGLADPAAYNPLSFLAGGTVGLCINLCAGAFDWLLVGPVAARVPAAAGVVRMVAFFLGGACGWLLGNGLFAIFLGTSNILGSAGLWLPAAFFGVMGLVVGLVFYTVEQLRERLRASVARIKEQEFAEKELELARSIQRRLMPPSEVAGDGYRLAGRTLPARVVAGDFYDVYPAAGAVGVAVGDVSGKGMGAALIMASAKAMIPLVAAERPADETLRELNSRLLRDLAPREFVALLVFHLDPASGRFELANAGLPDPYLLRPGAPPGPLRVPGPRLPLGLRRGIPYQRLEGRLEPGQRVFFFTDGLPEAPVADDEPIGYTELEAFVGHLLEGGPSHALGRLVEELSGRVRGRADDWTAVLLEVLAVG